MNELLQQFRDNRILDCGHKPSPHGEHTTGTAHTQDKKEICWECAAMADLGRMLLDGNSSRLPLYLSKKEDKWTVSNWPGTLSFPVMNYRKGYHNIARTREDVWFIAPDNYIWHGTLYGEWTQIVHCKRTKEYWRVH